MNRFNSYIFILCILLSSFSLRAQERDTPKDLDIEHIAAKIERLGSKIADAAERQAQKIARDAENLALPEWKDTQQIASDNDLDFSSAHVKSIQKVYLIKKNTPLSIDNKYGKVEVQTWNKQEIRVDINIRAIDANGDKARDLINSVSITESKSASQISLSTQFQTSGTSWWNKVIKGDRKGLQIDYLIYMPKNNNLSIQHRYGAVVLPDLRGDLRLDLSYGNLQAGRLSGINTDIRASYGSAKIEALRQANLNVRYGTLNLGEADNIHLDIDYCGGSRVGVLHQSGDINLAYSGGFRLGLGKGIQHLQLDAAYSSSELQLDPMASFAFEVQLSYGDFHRGPATISREDPGPDSRGPKLHKTYTGYYRQLSSNQVRIQSSYGSVHFE